MKAIRLLMSALCCMYLFSCSGDDDSGNDAVDPFEAEKEQLQARVQNMNTYADAVAAGYNTLVDSEIHPDGFFANMGYHYLNADLLDDEFDPANPEAILIYCDGDGNYEVVGVEYIVTAENPGECPEGCTPPEGFTGNSDEWKWNTEFMVWTLHAWPKASNSAGYFAPMNSAIDAEKACDAPDAEAP